MVRLIAQPELEAELAPKADADDVAAALSAKADAAAVAVALAGKANVPTLGGDPTGAVVSNAAFTEELARTDGILALPDGAVYLLNEWDPGRPFKLAGNATIIQAPGARNAIRSTVPGRWFDHEKVIFDQRYSTSASLDNGVVHYEDAFPIKFDHVGFHNISMGPSLRISNALADQWAYHGAEFLYCDYFGNEDLWTANLTNQAGFVTVQNFNNGRVVGGNARHVRGSLFWIQQRSGSTVCPRDWKFQHTHLDGAKRANGGGGFIYYRGHDLTLEDITALNCSANSYDIQGPNAQTEVARGIKLIRGLLRNAPGVISSRQHIALILLRACAAEISGMDLMPDDTASRGGGIDAKWGGSLVLEKTTILKPRLYPVRVSAGTTANTIDFDLFEARGNTIFTRSSGEAAFLLQRAGTPLVVEDPAEGEEFDGDGPGRIRFAHIAANRQGAHNGSPLVRVVYTVAPTTVAVDHLHLGVNRRNAVDALVESGLVTTTTRAAVT